MLNRLHAWVMSYIDPLPKKMLTREDVLRMPDGTKFQEAVRAAKIILAIRKIDKKIEQTRKNTSERQVSVNRHSSEFLMCREGWEQVKNHYVESGFKVNTDRSHAPMCACLTIEW